MLKKTIPVLSRLTRSLMGVFVLLTCMALPLARVSGTVLLDKVIAKVNKEEILYSDLQRECNRLALEGKKIDEQLQMHVLRELVLNKIFLSKAKSYNINIPKKHIQKTCDFRIAGLVQRFGSEEKLVEAARQPIYHIKKNIKQRIESEILASQVYQHLTKHVVVTPAEVKAYFNALPLDKRSYCPSSVQVHQLVVYPKVAAARQETVKNKLLHLKKLLLAGRADFVQLAKEHSDDPYSAHKGGEIGWVPLGALAPAYESTALALKSGEISDPIASEFGWHLIQLIGRNKNQYNTRHILQVVQPTEEEIRLAKVELDKIKAEIVAGKLTFEAAVQQYSEDKETAAQGGLIATPYQGGDRLPSLFVPVESLDSEVYFAIDRLQVGEVSAPQYMGTSHKSAWRLLLLKQKVEAHLMNLTQDYEQIHYGLLQKRKKEAVDKWIQTAKSEFVIYFAPEYRTVEQLL
ncbi:MAG: peptidylprolyl isomerase [Candidatus Cardinium sp.]|uniref:peptidylprolyl isomerase n=1 Tax=Cardinium endosymbiont of Dermatophagoides farinae TaxID=2597823 RepID=UPI001182CEE7|nr:peptidylprolyl isomerase [Cardinium endosymbiont of Dermatophagoides farinae]TSJ81216.1 hypothetical protein FPG78_04435 [Cardinium endosymbiont of Dermatophagoides farinae]UWW97266.1 MAG: peptidylprolyl isomerase [Candidatus Cardinium sp.]